MPWDHTPFAQKIYPRASFRQYNLLSSLQCFHDIRPLIHIYLKNPLSENELNDLLIKLNKKPQEVIRTQEEIYKSEFKGKNFTDDEWLKILVENPKLIQRPIVVKRYKAVIGDPLENLYKIV